MLAEVGWADYFAALSIMPTNVPSEPRYNVCPTQRMPVVTDREGQAVARIATWGLKPQWNPKQLLINARLETAATARTFKAAWTTRRCLVPATGWWEWTGQRGAKQPWAITRDRPFFFAGLWFETADLETAYVILTRAADPEIAHIHDRMPVILTEDDRRDWFEGGADPQSLGAGVGPALAAWKVPSFGIRDEGPGLLEPVAGLL